MARKKLTFKEWANKQQKDEGQFFIDWLGGYLRKYGYKKFHVDKGQSELDELITDVINADKQRLLFADQLKKAWHSHKHAHRNKVATLSISTTEKVKKKFQNKAKKLGISQSDLIEELLLNDEVGTEVGSVSIARRAIKSLKEMKLQKQQYEKERRLPVGIKLRRLANSMLRTDANLRRVFLILAEEMELNEVNRRTILEGLVVLMADLAITDDELESIIDSLDDRRKEYSDEPEW